MYASCYEEVLVTVYGLRKEMVEKPENTPAKLAMNPLYKPEKIIKPTGLLPGCDVTHTRDD